METSTDFLSRLSESELTVDELNEIAESAISLAESAETRYAKLFELGDTVRNSDGEVGTVVRRNVHTVSVLFRGAESPVKVTPSSIVDILDVLDDPSEFDYFDYFGNTIES